MSGLFGGAKNTAATTSNTVLGLQVQTSLQGKPLTLAYGTNKSPPNLIHAVGFRVIEHTEQQGGGKGGSSAPTTTTYEYRASYALGLMDGLCAGVSIVWRDKDVFRGGLVTPPEVVRVHEAVCNDAPYQVTVPEASTHKRNVRVLRYQEDGDGREELAAIGYASLVGGTYGFGSAVGRIRIEYVTQDPPYMASALDMAGMGFKSGSLGQSAWSLLASQYPAQADAYSGIAYVTVEDGVLDGGGAIPQHQVAFTGLCASAGADANGADIIADLLSDTVHGLGGVVGCDVANYRHYCAQAGLLISPHWTEQAPARQRIEEVLASTNSDVRPHDGTLQVVPLGDQAVGTWVPDTAPAYVLTDDDLVPAEGDLPVRVTRQLDSLYNSVSIEYSNRANDYTREPYTVQDDAAIEADGLQAADVIQAHAVTEAAVAAKLAHIKLQHHQGVRARYTFRLFQRHMLIEPLDDLVLDTAISRLSMVPVRVNSIDEDPDGYLTIEAEDRPPLSGTPKITTPPLSSAWYKDSNTLVGSVSDWVVCESPNSGSATGLALLIGATSDDANWGGCGVWISYDGASYQHIGRITAAARVGVLRQEMDGAHTTVEVLLSGRAAEMQSASSTAAASLATLCAVIDGDNTEYIAHAAVTLQAANRYRLHGLVRGAYGSLRSSHAAGKKFVRIDDALLSTGPLDASLVGKTVYLKLTSFNTFGFAEQSLADVPALSYAVGGLLLRLPPPDVSGLGVSVSADGERIYTWSAASLPDDVTSIEFRYATPGPTAWDAMTLLDTRPARDGVWRARVPVAGTWDIAARFVDSRGNLSVGIAEASAVAMGAGITSISAGKIIEDGALSTDELASAAVVEFVNYFDATGLVYGDPGSF